MPLSQNRRLIQISDKAYQRLQQIKRARKKLGLPYSTTGYASELILLQPVPTAESAHWVVPGTNGNGAKPAGEDSGQLSAVSEGKGKS